MTKRCACAGQVQNSKNQDISSAAVRANNQRSIASFAVSAEQQEAAVRCLVKAIVTANIPFTFIENPQLKKGLKHVSVSLLSCRQLADKYIPEMASEAEATTAELFSKMTLIDASSDAWRQLAAQDWNPCAHTLGYQLLGAPELAALV